MNKWLTIIIVLLIVSSIILAAAIKSHSSNDTKDASNKIIQEKAFKINSIQGGTYYPDEFELIEIIDKKTQNRYLLVNKKSGATITKLEDVMIQTEKIN